MKLIYEIQLTKKNSIDYILKYIINYSMDVERFRKNIMMINSDICAKYSVLITQKQK